MTRQEAINHLKNDWFRSLGGQLCVDGDKIDNFLEAVGMGIKELSIPESSNQAQIEKEKNEPLSEERFEEICEAVHAMDEIRYFVNTVLSGHGIARAARRL